MKPKTCFSVLALLLLVALPFILGSCVLPGTGTIRVLNWLTTGSITSLYIYPQGSPDTIEDLPGTLHKNDGHDEIGLAPGPWTIHAVIDDGRVAEENKTVVEGTYHVVSIADGDVI